jgi:hypothetical protein
MSSILGVEIYGTTVAPADAVLFWSHRDGRRFIYPLDWPNAKELLERILRRFPSGSAHWVNLQSSVGRISTTGQPAKLLLGDHAVGLVRPWLAGQLPEAARDAAKPVLLSKQGAPPILFADIADGREFARRVRDEHAVNPSEWNAYAGEFQTSDAEKMWVEVLSGVVLRTRLEEELGRALRRGHAAGPPQRG